MKKYKYKENDIVTITIEYKDRYNRNKFPILLTGLKHFWFVMRHEITNLKYILSNL